MALLARVYLVRHGETNENRDHIIQGQQDTLLNSLGLKQAELVGNALRSIPFDVAYSSDLSRAVSTAQEILVHHPNVATHQEQKELRERYMGALEGKVAGVKVQGDDKTMESGAFFAARAETWWMRYILDGTASFPRRDGPYHILVTTHGGFIGALMRTLLQRKKVRWGEGVVGQRCLNTSVTIIDVDKAGQGLIVQSCDITHLRGLAEEAVENNADVDAKTKVALP